MVVRAKYWTHGFSRIALYFIDEKFRGSYPSAVSPPCRSDSERALPLNLADCIWFELTPGERPEELFYPDKGLIAVIAPTVCAPCKRGASSRLRTNRLAPVNSNSQPQPCAADFSRPSQASVTEAGLTARGSRSVGLRRRGPPGFRRERYEGPGCFCELVHRDGICCHGWSRGDWLET